ncbi:Uncharacterised protein [Pseudomonas luteola]|uniref:Uncharacterized protein n=1 Tax=Pseudomonas luteola TaxID=47886 RepID=A0A2X2ETR2_PSELU|nr:Uncharacterised protein [Pseudomonas luteola]
MSSKASPIPSITGGYSVKGIPRRTVYCPFVTRYVFAEPPERSTTCTPRDEELEHPDKTRLSIRATTKLIPLPLRIPRSRALRSLTPSPLESLYVNASRIGRCIDHCQCYRSLTKGSGQRSIQKWNKAHRIEHLT